MNHPIILRTGFIEQRHKDAVPIMGGAGVTEAGSTHTFGANLASAPSADV
jgi:hypothetical protein